MRIPVWLVAASIIVMSLVTGVFLGAAVQRRMLFHMMRPGGPNSVFWRLGTHHPGPGTMVPGHLEQELGLSPTQSAAVDSITRHRMAQRDSLMAHTWPAMRALLDSTRTDIEKVLTPEQRVKFEQLRSHRFGGDGPPPPPMPMPSESSR